MDAQSPDLAQQKKQLESAAATFSPDDDTAVVDISTNSAAGTSGEIIELRSTVYTYILWKLWPFGESALAGGALFENILVRERGGTIQHHQSSNIYIYIMLIVLFLYTVYKADLPQIKTKKKRKLWRRKKTSESEVSKTPATSAKSVPYFSLFRFATPFEKLMIVIGMFWNGF